MSASTYAWPSFEAPENREQAQARAREEAARQGYAEGKARAEAELAEQRDTLARGLAELNQQLESLGEEQAKAVTELALAVTRKLLVAELRTNPTVLEGLVHQALTALEAGIEQVQVLVNPADRELLAEALARQDDAPAFTLREDPSVPGGGVSVTLGAKSVEFDPFGRLESFVEQEFSDGAVGGPPGESDREV